MEEERYALHNWERKDIYPKKERNRRVSISE